MKIENEITILEINKKDFIEKIEKLGAKKESEEVLQVRYVYDFNPALSNKWIRLRTNGKKSTLTIKELSGDSKMNAKEWEIEVSDFEETNAILNELGYFHRNKQENKRQIYTWKDVEISIDTWPLIPTYVELESDNIEQISELLKLLNISEDKVTTLDVTSIYEKIYNIDIMKIKNLVFEEKQIKHI